MSESDVQRSLKVAAAIDAFITLDLSCLGVGPRLFTALQRHRPGLMCLGAAQFLKERLRPGEGLVCIATGFPMGGGVPETDGPVGAAMLARALHQGLGVQSVLVTDTGWEESLRAACIGAGLSPLPLSEQGVERIRYLRPAYIASVPRDAAGCESTCLRLLDLKPDLLIAIERPGKNRCGVYHGMNGRPLAGHLSDVERLFELGRERGLPVLGIGDGGNEIGMGVIAEDLPDFLPQAADCGCPCGGGTAAAFAADCLVVSCVSNWGAAGINAALALLLGDLDILQEPEREQRAIELCANTGAVDGVSVSPEPSVDGIPAVEWYGLLRSLRGIVQRGLAKDRDWRRLVHAPAPTFPEGYGLEPPPLGEK